MGVMFPQNVEDYLLRGCMRCQYGSTPKCKVHKWQDELKALRDILLSSALKEEIKWGVPCYTFQQKNVIILAAFKNYVSLNFFKGEWIQDAYGLLEKSGNNTHKGRVIRFTSIEQILENTLKIQDYIAQAIEIEKSGNKLANSHNQQAVQPPSELLEMLESDEELAQAFFQLTPKKQLGYIIYFTLAKQSKTRYRRIEKCKPKILEGKGLNE